MKTLVLALGLLLPALALQDAASQKPAVPEVGKPAPTIRLNDHEGMALRLGPGGRETWTVLAFFPKAATPG